MAAFATPIDKTGIFKIFNELAYLSRHDTMVLLWYHKVNLIEW